MHLNQCTAAAIYFIFKPIFIIPKQAMQILYLFLIYLRLIPDSQRAGWERRSGTGSLMTCDTCTTSLPLFSSTKSRDISLRGPTPFEDMIFYLWTDCNEICTAYVKLKINHILFVKIF